MNLEKTIVFHQIFPNQKEVPGKLDKLMSKLLKHVHHFIMLHFRKEKEDSIGNRLILVEFFRKRKDAKLEIVEFKKTQQEYKKIDLIDKQYYYYGYLLGKTVFQKKFILSQKTKPFDYELALKPLDIYYLLNKLEFTCFLLSINLSRRPIEISKIIEFLSLVKPIYEEKGLLRIPLVSIYYQTFEMLKKVGGDMVEYRKLKEKILLYEGVLPFDALKILNGILRSFIIHNYNNGAVNLKVELFLLHKEHLAKGYFDFEKGILSAAFKNMITIGLLAKDYDWVYTFLKTYKNRIIGSKHPEDDYNYNLAHYYFSIKDYEKALGLIKGKYEDLHYQLAAKRLELRIFYETNSTILDSKIDAFKIYAFRLSKQSISKQKRVSNNNFIDFLRQIRNPKTQYSHSRIEKLHAKINNTSILNDRDWLIEKLEELKV
ncbi:MAG: hypothetical protein AB8H03_08300 [Saprospiraceae bacterium]